MTEITGNILSIKKGIICHQVNCQGRMGSGIALQFRETYPKVYKTYQTLCSSIPSAQLLGRCQLVKIDDNLLVANIFGQEYYGTDKRYTDYEAVAKSFKSLENWRDLKLRTIPQDKIYIPYKMGCNLGGGLWHTYLEVVTSIIPNVTVVKLP